MPAPRFPFPGRALKPGTLLRREWQGVLHTVEALNEGFAWSGDDLQEPLRGRPGHHRHPLEWAALLWPARGLMTRSSVRRLRCAVYTRVSTEAGLEQEFNSLDNQREAAEAYIKSQAHEGWRLLPARYDDGGFSGGSLQRPALQQLLADLRAGLIDVVVVYKVDRLTRALADFAKLVELFDAHGVSFVSVTQAFNTTSSMGRLTLNVLLSFAQFEREVTGERIRDKIAASKKKGLWMGGHVPLGYRMQDRKLVGRRGRGHDRAADLRALSRDRQPDTPASGSSAAGCRDQAAPALERHGPGWHSVHHGSPRLPAQEPHLLGRDRAPR